MIIKVIVLGLNAQGSFSLMIFFIPILIFLM